MRKKKVKYAIILKGRKEPFMFFQRREEAERFINKDSRWIIKEVEEK